MGYVGFSCRHVTVAMALVVAALANVTSSYQCPNEKQEVTMCMRMSGRWSQPECHCYKPILHVRRPHDRFLLLSHARSRF